MGRAEGSTPPARKSERLLAAVTLLLLSPFVGEFVLGNSPATELYLLPILVPLYGAGALLVRELGRRTGGWPSIALLALAYSLLQPALIEMSLFNPGFVGEDFSALYLPELGFSPYYALTFVGGHFIWSICLPILLVELICRRDVAEAPWLGRLGLVGVVILFVLGLALYLDEFQTTQHFVAPWPHLAVSALAVIALIALALRWRSTRVASRDGWVPAPPAIGLGALVLSSVFFAAPEDWSGVALKLAALGLAAFCILRWTRSTGWTWLHASALAAGTMLTYVWGSFILISLMGRTTAFDFVAQIGVALLAIAVCAIASSRHLRPA